VRQMLLLWLSPTGLLLQDRRVSCTCTQQPMPAHAHILPWQTVTNPQQQPPMLLMEMLWLTTTGAHLVFEHSSSSRSSMGMRSWGRLLRVMLCVLGPACRTPMLQEGQHGCMPCSSSGRHAAYRCLLLLMQQLLLLPWGFRCQQTLPMAAQQLLLLV